MVDIFQSKSTEGIEGKYEQEIKEITEKIKLNPNEIDLYYSKIKILIYYEQFIKVLEVLDKMSKVFPESEKDIKMKSAFVLRRMQEFEAGLKIIEELIIKYPDDNDLFNYKAYWLQYLDKKEESLDIIEDLVARFPDNGMYHDTYGEILMFFEYYEKAAEIFLLALDKESDNWDVHQTYIKLGICYKELKNHELAVKNLERGIKIKENEVVDLETKEKWLSIAKLFLAEMGDDF